MKLGGVGIWKQLQREKSEYGENISYKILKELLKYLLTESKLKLNKNWFGLMVDCELDKMGLHRILQQPDFWFKCWF